MQDYKPSFPFSEPIYLLKPVKKIVKGVSVKTYSEPSDDDIIFCSFKTYGGTEQTVNGLLSVVDTANIETWYNPDIKTDCRIALVRNPEEVYDIISKPENINMRNQFMKFKVKAIGGGA